jgi:predicted flap endonuclease-1-like 5' DNA nuclease
MTSALAAALRELDRSRDDLEQKLSQSPDYVAFRRFETQPDRASPEAVKRRQILLGRLEALPLFQAWQAIVAAKKHVESTDALLSKDDLTGIGQAGWVPAALSRAPSHSAGAGASALLQQRLFTPPPGPPQPLTAIRGIGPAVARHLQALGIERYEQIAAWRAGDVAAVRKALGLDREISRRNWIEQAALLAMRASGQPLAAIPVRATPANAPPAVLPPEPSAPPKPSASPAPAAPPAPGPGAATLQAPGYGDMLRIAAVAAQAAVAAIEIRSPRSAPLVSAAIEPPVQSRNGVVPDEASVETQVASTETQVAPSAKTGEVVADPLLWIQGIDAAIAAKLCAAAAGRFAVIAAWRAEDIEAIARLLSVAFRRISSEGWVEQAAVLATGRATAYSVRVVRGELDAICHAPPLSPPPAPRMAPPAVALETFTAADAARSSSPPALPPEAPAPEADETVSVSPLERVGRLDRSLARMIEEELAQSVVEEASVTIIGHAPPVDAASSRRLSEPHSLGTATPQRPALGAAVQAVATPAPGTAAIGPARPPLARPPAGAAPRHTGSGQPLASRPVAPARAEETDEAVVEIIRKADPLALPAGGAAAKSAINRPPPVKTSRPQGGDRLHDPQQPAWIADKGKDAGGVVRRFLKALKRGG